MLNLTIDEEAAIRKALAGAAPERVEQVLRLFSTAVKTEAEDAVDAPDNVAGFVEDSMTALRAYWTTRVAILEAERDDWKGKAMEAAGDAKQWRDRTQSLQDIIKAALTSVKNAATILGD